MSTSTPGEVKDTGRLQLTYDEWFMEGTRRFGKDKVQWKFICPSCGTVQSCQDWLDANVDKYVIDRQIAFSCIGRHVKGKGCNWTLGGLFQIHTVEILQGGKAHPVFEFAEPTEILVPCLEDPGDK